MTTKTVVAMLLAASFFGACSGQEPDWPSTRFNTDAWKRMPERQRYQLVTDLINQRLLDGKNKKQVIELLGPPSSELENPGFLGYVVKLGGASFDQVFILDIRFESGWDRVTSAGIRGD